MGKEKTTGARGRTKTKMERATVVIIGGGITGVGILRDLSMRGVDALLIEKGDLVNGASSRYHGLLHSGGRYAVKDPEAAQECIRENRILKRIAKSAVEQTPGLFVRLEGDDPAYEERWRQGCEKAGIPCEPLALDALHRAEPRLTQRIVSAYRVPDAAIDGFRLSWQNIESAKQYGGRFLTYTEVEEILLEGSGRQVKGVRVCDRLTGKHREIGCDILVNAGGGWAGKIAALAGVEVGVQPDKGTLLVFNQRIAHHIVNRLHPSADGDIFVPHGSVTILGTTSMSIEDPEDTHTSRAEVEHLLSIGEQMFERLRDYRLLRCFAGSRPLYLPPHGEKGRSASRGFAVIDHEARDGLKGFFTIVGGKFTTYRLMAEKLTDAVCRRLGNHHRCRTAEEPLVPEVSEEEKDAARPYFPSYGTELAADRLGPKQFRRVVKKLRKYPEKRQVICECENVTRAEIEEIAALPTTHSLLDVRRRTRLSMGTCQGNFCTFRAASVCRTCGHGELVSDPVKQMREHLEERWKGIRPVLVGRTLREVEMMRGIYELVFNVNGTLPAGNPPAEDEAGKREKEEPHA